MSELKWRAGTVRPDGSLLAVRYEELGRQGRFLVFVEGLDEPRRATFYDNSVGWSIDGCMGDWTVESWTEMPERPTV